ncbi:MAG: DegV family protein, partial [Acidobacteriota bacterium]
MRPAILFIDPDDDRRRAVATSVAERGYEVIPASSSAEGTRFAAGLNPSVVVGPIELPTLADTTILEQMASESGAISRTLVLLGRGSEPEGLPDEVRFLNIDALDFAEIGRRISLVLIGREVGLEPDVELHYLVGDLGIASILDVSRALSECLFTGTLELPTSDGRIAFVRGRLTHAALGSTVAAKAFCRLARLRSAAPFAVRLGASGLQPNLVESLDELALFALEEAHLELPDPRSRIALMNRDRVLPSGEWTQSEIQLASVLEAHETVGSVLDNLPSRDGLLILALRKMIERGALKLKEPRSEVVVVTDSTSDLPPRLAREHGIQIVPLSVFFGQEELRDGVDIKARDFYRMLQEDENHPRSEPPAEAVFFEHYHDLIERQDILSIHLSSRLSRTRDHAQKAALRGIRSFTHLPPERSNCALEVIDSRQVSAALGLQAIFAARMAA